MLLEYKNTNKRFFCHQKFCCLCNCQSSLNFKSFIHLLVKWKKVIPIGTNASVQTTSTSRLERNCKMFNKITRWLKNTKPSTLCKKSQYSSSTIFLSKTCTYTKGYNLPGKSNNLITF